MPHVTITRAVRRQIFLGLALTIGCAARSQSPPPTDFLVAHPSLCVTEGALEDSGALRMSVNVPKMRAYMNRPSADAAELRFTYVGPTTQQIALASGASRQQLGLKLRAADPCNLVYVMWRLEPRTQLVVSIKTNPDEHSSSQCGNRGYRNIKPQSHGPLPSVTPGTAHRLSAEIRADQVWVYADGSLAWQGQLGSDAAALRGPVGLRTDNVRLDFQLAVERPRHPTPDVMLRCRSGPEEAE
jgi:hypothetical protein